MSNPFSNQPSGFGQSNPFGQASPFGTSSGGFGSGNPFGTNQASPAFGNPPPGTGFGSPQTAPGFGQSQPGSGFGPAQPVFGGTQTGGQTGSGFGTSQTSTAGFGIPSVVSGFGTNTLGSHQTGTGFGSTTQNQIGTGFGSVPNASGSGFGTQGPSFRGTDFGAGTTGTQAFGTTSSTLGASGFGMQAQSNTGVFGDVGTSTSSALGGPGFGTSTQGGSALGVPGFGTSTQGGSVFGGSSFKTTTSGSSVFGGSGFGTATKSTFGGSGFSTAGTTSTVQGGMFGGSNIGNTSQASGFRTTSGGSSQGGGFGTSTSGTSNSGVFGQSNLSGTTQTSGFGTSQGGMFGVSNTSQAGFGTSGVTPKGGMFGVSGSGTQSGGFGTSTSVGILGGQSQTSTTSTGFNADSSTSSFGGSTFGVPQQGSSGFGQNAPSSVPGGQPTGLFGVQSTGTGGTTTSSGSTGTIGWKGFGNEAPTGPQSMSSSFPAQPSSSALPTKEEKKSDSARNLFGKPELKVNPLISELSPPSTVLNAVPAVVSGSSFGGSDRPEAKSVFGGTQPLSTSQQSSGLFGKTESSADENKKKDLSSKKMLFGKLVAGSGIRRKSVGEQGSSFDNFDHTSKRKPSKENEEEPVSKRSVRRMSSTDDMTHKVAIVCNNVPIKYNNVIAMRKHFSKYGEVVKVFPNPRKLMTTVHFKTHDDAREAKTRGRFLDKGVRPMEIFWKSFRRRSNEDSDTTPGKRKSSDFSYEKPAISKSSKFKWAKNDLDDELAGMSGTSDVNEEQIKIMDRPDEYIESQVKGTASRSGSAHSLGGSPARHGSPVPTTSKTAVTIPTTVDKGSLTVLRSTVCHTTADKLQILNLRDKIIRLGMKKTSNIKSQAFVGTCPDMCPEKERYDRVEKRRLHVYETLNPGSQNPQVDHSKAVKEYSRSSADQEEPLPHELRPLPVLILTMNFLLCEIADKGEDGKWGEWFDFLWDRTRGIRKDITQQQLSSPDSAELLEKCVRFHIFCSERLCEEDMHSFDLKINNENMTKCLQTLKEFYHDLEKKHNVFCRNEAEMRSYMVLMNLNEGDILRETQQLRPEIRNTSHINLAVQVHSALNSNNFVRFFKLVKHASFLQASIMHRYFTQVRTRALFTLLKAYRPKSHYTFTEMVRVMGFEDKKEARYFCKFHGLHVTEEYVLLDRTAYIEPEESWLPRRSPTLIESKLISSVGQVMNGEILQPMTLPSPVNSFDDNNRFVGKLDVNVSDIQDIQFKPVQAQDNPISTEPEIKPQVKLDFKPEVKPPKFTYTNDDVKEIAKHLFWDVIEDMAKEVSDDLLLGAKMMANQTELICDNIVEEVVTEYVRSLSGSYYAEATMLKQKKDKEIMIQTAAVQMTSDIIKDVIDQEVLNLATTEIREVKATLKKQQIERSSDEITEELIDLIAMEMSEEVADEVYQKDVVERLEELEDICHCVELQRAGKFLQRWKKEYSSSVKLKRAMLDFPPSVGMESNYDQVKKLVPCRQNDVCDENGFYVNNMAKLKIDTPDRDLTVRWVADRMLTAHELYRKMSHLKAWQPLDMAATVGTQIQKHFSRCKSKSFYWKLVLSLPDAGQCQSDDNRAVTELLNKWLRSKFTKGKDEAANSQNKDLLSLYRTKLPCNHSERVEDLALCIKSVGAGDISHSDILGTSGIIFVLPPGMTDNLSSIYWHNARNRFQTLIQLKGSYPAVPLVVIAPMLPDEEFSEIINYGLDLPQSIDDELISSVFLQMIDQQDDGYLNVEQPDVTDQLIECVQWLAQGYPTQPDITVKFLKDYIDDFLREKFFEPVLQNLKLRKQTGYLHQQPEELVQLYNFAISHLTRVLSSPTVIEQSWPVSEFFSTKNIDFNLAPSHWNTEDHLDNLLPLIETLLLPWFLNDDFEKDDWADICEVLWVYIDKVIDECDGQPKIDLYSKIRLILKRTEEDFRDICYLLEKETKCEPSHENIPWTDIITACIDFKMSATNFLDAQLDQKCELMAVYLKKELEKYSPPDIWRYMESEREIGVSTSMVTSMQIAKTKSKAKKSEQSLLHDAAEVTLNKNNACVVPDIEPECVQSARKVSSSLKADLKKEQQDSDKYEQFLKNALLGEDINSTTIPDVSGLPPWSVFDSPNKSMVGDNKLTESLSEPLITDELDRFRKDIDRNRRASDLFELQLRQWIGSPV